MLNIALQNAIASYESVETNYVSRLASKGLKFAERGSSEDTCESLRNQLRLRGVTFRNGGASISSGWLSKACVECTGTGGSETFSTTLRCHRDCYFCFNHNLAEYKKYFNEGCPWEKELSEAYEATGGNMAVVGLSGGEPLLSLESSLEFLAKAGELFPNAHKRMYTSGDLLTEDGAIRLRDAGLTEIRFSVKQEDTDQLRERVLEKMALAVSVFDDVVVEMPIIPGTESSMQEWMRRFEDVGIRGMNLLEFCFPFHSWDEFEKRGFLLKNPPFSVMYDYSYSGGLAIAGSEELALKLMLFGLDEAFSYGMHYCSLENKHRSEIRQINERGKNIHPVFEFDEEDFFLKTGKVFGEDRDIASKILKTLGCKNMVADDDEQSLTFPAHFAKALQGTSVTSMLAFNVLEKDENGHFLREVALKPVV